MSQMGLGRVQSNAVALIGLQSPEMLQIEIELEKNGYKQNGIAIEEGNVGVKDKMDSTIAYGIDEKKQLMKQSIGGMIGSSLAMGAGLVGLAGSAYSTSEANAAKTRLNNLDEFEKGFQNPGANEIEMRNLAEGGENVSPLSNETETPFKNDFMDKSLEERGSMFDKSADSNYFGNSALEFSTEAEREEAQNTITELRKSFQSDQEIAEKRSVLFPQQASDFGRALSGLSESAGNMFASFEKIAQANDQIIQQAADFTMQFAKSMQETMSQSISTAVQMANQIIQNEQTIAGSQRV